MDRPDRSALLLRTASALGITGVVLYACALPIPWPGGMIRLIFVLGALSWLTVRFDSSEVTSAITRPLTAAVLAAAAMAAISRWGPLPLARLLLPAVGTVLAVCSLVLLELAGHRRTARLWIRRLLTVGLLALGFRYSLPLGMLGLLMARPGRWLPNLVGRRRWTLPGLALVGIAALSFAPLGAPLPVVGGAAAAASAASLLRGTLLALLLYSLFFPEGMQIRHKMILSFLLNGVVPILLIGALAGLALYAVLGASLASTVSRDLDSLAEDARTAAEAAISSIERQPFRPLGESLVSSFRRLMRDRLNGGLVVGRGEDILVRAGEVSDEIRHPLDQRARFYTNPDEPGPLYIVGTARSDEDLWCVAQVRADEALAQYLSEGAGVPLAIGSCVAGLFRAQLEGTHLATLCNHNGWDLGPAEPDHRLFMLGGGLLVDPTGPTGVNGQIMGAFSLYANRTVIRSALLSGQDLGSQNVTFGVDRTIRLGGRTGGSDNPFRSNLLINLMIVIIGGFIAVIAGAVILASISLGFGIARSVTGSIRRLRDGAESLRAGDLTTRIRVAGRDELTDLGQVFNSMAESLETGAVEKERHLKAKLVQERLQEEIATAQLIQATFLPTFDPDLDGVQLLGYCRPAAEVGGDYYDYLPLDSDRLGLVIGDVSGHGVSSGLLMAMAKSCLHNQIKINHQVPEVMDALNRMVHDALQQKLIMTLAYLVLEIPDGRLAYASAGHHYPYLIHSDGTLTTLEDEHYPLGVRVEERFQVQEARMVPGDRLVLYSDGIVEAMDPDGRPLGFDQLEELLRGSADLSPEELQERLLDRVDRHLQGLSAQDDITFLIVDYGGRESAPE